MRGQEDDENGLKFDKEAPMASFRQILQFSEWKHKAYAIIGTISAALAGWSIPCVVAFLSDLYNSFGPDTSDKEQYGKKDVLFRSLKICLSNYKRLANSCYDSCICSWDLWLLNILFL